MTQSDKVITVGLTEVNQLWQQARADNTPGLPADPILDQLERKYQALADAADATK
jgi:antitoxin ParD1/3/4